MHRQLRSRQAEDRVDALHRLQKYPVAEAVRMVHSTFDDADVDVRHEAYNTLLAMNGEQEVCDTLAELVAKAMKDRTHPRRAPPALAALLSSNLPLAQIQARRLLNETVANSPLGSEVVQGVADGLGQSGRASDVLALTRLTSTKPFDDYFGVRRAVVDALVHIQKKEAVAALISIMDRVGGEAKADAAQHLTKVTGQIFGMESGAWRRWWAEAEPTFNHPPVAEEGPDSELAGEGRNGYYYGLPLHAQRIVFVLDTSGSMEGPRIVAAKRELAKAINGLPESVEFSVVVFNRWTNSWQRELVPADDKRKHSAIEFIDRQLPQANTASFDALQAALVYDTEAIYFLSDGAPTGGKVVAPVDIVQTISNINKARRVSIYTIGIAPGTPGSPTDAFLSTLAAQNRGKYRRVDD